MTLSVPLQENFDLANNITITIFAPGMSQEVIDFILPIQREEFGVHVSLNEQPDLKNINVYFQEGSSNFWVALLNDEVIGTIALKDIGNHGFALKKMFVREDWRGSKPSVAHALLLTAIKWAKSFEGQKIILGSTPVMTRAHRFYENHGFVKIGKSDLPPGFPIVPVDEKFYVLTI